ncbi:MAG: hypothetical protein R2771_01475 [Saprospiraceae bacterium]
MGKTLYYEDYSKLSFDIAGNAFYAKTKGLDINLYPYIAENEALKNTGYDAFFYNYKMGMGGLGIDLKSTYNQNRTDQRWYASLLLGLNSGLYTVNMDIKDSDGNYYISEFERIKNSTKADKKQELNEILDGDYETKAEGFENFPLKIALMPSVGVELGYDITDFLSFFVSDKLYIGVSNKIDGETHFDSNNDHLNYLSAGLNFYFGKKQKARYNYSEQKRDAEPVPSTRKQSGYNIPQEVEDHNLPEVKIIEPSEKQSISDKKYINIRASLINVASANDIYCKVNNEIVDFEYRENYVQFVAELTPGENKIQVYANNDNGQARDVIEVFFEDTSAKPSKPVINLIDPSSLKFKSDEEVFTIKANIQEVKSKSDISITANDYPLNSFNFSKSSGDFKIKVRLAEGLNTFVITASNENGSSDATFDIYYNVDIPEDNNTGGLPEITIISPNQNTENISNELIDFKAKVTGIKNKSDIVFTVNGMENKMFDYDENTGIVSDKISIFDEETLIKIVASNAFGDSSNEINVKFNKKMTTMMIKRIDNICQRFRT